MGESGEGLSEGAFASSVEGFGIGDDAFGAGIGVEDGARGELVDRGRHAGFTGLFVVAGVDRRVVLGIGAGGGVVAGGASVFRMGGRSASLVGEEGIHFVLSSG